MKYLTDRRDGKAVQSISAEVTGNVNLAELIAERRKRIRLNQGEGGQ